MEGRLQKGQKDGASVCEEEIFFGARMELRSCSRRSDTAHLRQNITQTQPRPLSLLPPPGRSITNEFFQKHKCISHMKQPLLIDGY